MTQTNKKNVKKKEIQISFSLSRSRIFCPFVEACWMERLLCTLQVRSSIGLDDQYSIKGRYICDRFSTIVIVGFFSILMI